MMATINPGDEVLIPMPSWISYADIVKFAGGTPVPVPCHEEYGFKPLPQDVEAAITPKTKWLLLNYPSNPTGSVATHAELLALGETLLRHPHIWIMTDDIYEHLLYDGVKFWTLAQVEPRLYDRVLTVNGVSKAYSMTGWRLGFCGGPLTLIKAMSNVNTQNSGGVTTLAQAGSVAALDGPQDLLAERAESIASAAITCLSVLPVFTVCDAISRRGPSICSSTSRHLSEKPAPAAILSPATPIL